MTICACVFLLTDAFAEIHQNVLKSTDKISCLENGNLMESDFAQMKAATLLCFKHPQVGSTQIAF